jgi:branched-subunit amino acid permease
MQCWRSFSVLPLWVQIWVALILVPANGLAFFLLDTWAGKLTAIAALFVVMTNIPIMLIERGMSKLMAIPHLIAWYPLVIALIARLFSTDSRQETGDLEWTFMILVVVINGISLAFDTKDSIDWLRGNREVPGRTESNN